MVEEELPGRLVRLWRLRSEPRLGRPAELDVERIVRTAVDLADRDGLAGATLPKTPDSPLSERPGWTGWRRSASSACSVATSAAPSS
jgi:hypothetical protein